MGHKILTTDYLAKQDDWVRNKARLYICAMANDAQDAEMLLQTLGLLHDTRASDSDSINEPAPTERSI